MVRWVERVVLMDEMKTAYTIVFVKPDRKIPFQSVDWKAMGSTPEVSGFGSQQRQEIFLFSITFRPALGPTQPPIQWVLELFLRK
jgi:hypothetical protein